MLREWYRRQKEKIAEEEARSVAENEICIRDVGEYVKDNDPDKPLTPAEKLLCDEVVEQITGLSKAKRYERV